MFSHLIKALFQLTLERLKKSFTKRHWVNNGKRVPMYVCGNYAKQPVGILCRSAHRIKADHVMEIVAKTIKEVIQYAGLDKERFAEEIQSHIEDGADGRKQAVM